MSRILLCAGAVALATGSAYAKDISLADIVTHERVTQAVSTDNGAMTAFTRMRPRQPYVDDDGLSYVELFVYRDGKEVPYVTGDVRVGQVQFGPHGEYLYYLANRDDVDHASLYKMPVQGGESKLMLSHDTAIQSFDICAEGEYVLFRASEEGPDKAEELAQKGFRAKVYEEELRYTNAYLWPMGKEAEDVQEIPLDEHVHSVTFRPGHAEFLARVAPTPLVDDDLMLSSYAVFDMEGQEVVRADTEGKLGAAAFSPDGSELAVIGAEDQHDPAEGRLYHVNLEDGSIRDLLPGLMGHVQDLAWLNNEEVAYLADIDVETEVNAIHIESGDERTLLAAGEAIVSQLSTVQETGALTVLADRPTHPPEAFHLQEGELARLTDSNPWLADMTPPRQEVITHEARDGLRLQGIMVYPHNYEEGEPVPVIMSIHGGPEAHVRNGWNDRYSSPTWYAAQQGYATFFPNYRGSTGRGVDFSKLGQDDYAGKEFDDIVDAKEYLVEAGIADPDRVGITGGSYGGYASAWGATKQTEHFAASVMFVGISNNLSKFGTTDIPNEMHKVHARSYPWDKWDWYLERSPIYWAEQARTPILIMHGEEDTRVHPSQSMELYRYLKVHGNVPVRLVLYPGEGHGNARAAAQLDYAKRLMRWMDHYLIEQADGKPEHELPHAERLQ